jgi:phage terminase small subunit
MAKLLVREQRFIAEYLLDLDEGRAALAAGYATVADGKRLLHKRAVAAEIRRGRERQNERLRVDGERLLSEWAKIAFSNARDYFPGKGETLDLQRLDIDRTAAVAELQIDEQENPHTGQIYRRTKVRLHDKLAALRDLARATGMLRLAKGLKYLPAYEAAVAAGEIIEPDGEGGVGEAAAPHDPE